MSLYRNILSQAWQVTWRNKYLWFFGLFAALLGNSGDLQIVFRALNGQEGNDFIDSCRRFAQTGIFSKQALINAGHLFTTNPGTMVIMLFVCLLCLTLFVFLVWLAIVSQAAIVNDSAEIISAKKNKSAGIKPGIMTGTKYFWPVLGLNIFGRLVIFLAFILISQQFIAKILNLNNIAFTLIYVILFILFLVIAISFSLFIKYSIAYVVIKRNRLTESLRNGWNLFIGNWLVSVEMAIILFVVNLLVSLAIIIAVLTLTTPFVFLALLIGKVISIIGFWLVLMVAAIVLLLIVMLGGAMLSTFQISAWTALFARLIGKGGESKIVRIIEGITNRE